MRAMCRQSEWARPSSGQVIKQLQFLAGQCGLCAASQSRPGRQVVREKNVAVCSQSWRILIRSDQGKSIIQRIGADYRRYCIELFPLI